VWVDSHPDVGTGASQYPGYHAMAVSALVGRADPEIQALLPATVPAEHVALVGLHAWTDDDYPNIAEWGLTSFSPDDLRESSQGLMDWLATTGCTRAAIHFDVDTVDSNEIVLGLGAEPDGLTSAQVQRVLDDVGRSVEIVGLTIAEFVPRQVMHLQQILRSFPLLGG
jgi:arginase